MWSGKKKPSPLVTANTELQEEFCELRTRYWIRQGKWLPPLGHVMVGYCTKLDNEYGYLYRIKKHTDFTLAIDAALVFDPDERRRTLLHEMAHLYLRRHRDKGNVGEHPRWRNEIARLVRLGAYDGLL